MPRIGQKNGRRMAKARKFIVRLINGCALQFYANGKGYGVVPDLEATIFQDEHTAAMRARGCKVPWNQVVVEEIFTPAPKAKR